MVPRLLLQISFTILKINSLELNREQLAEWNFYKNKFQKIYYSNEEDKSRAQIYFKGTIRKIFFIDFSIIPHLF